MGIQNLKKESKYLKIGNEKQFKFNKEVLDHLEEAKASIDDEITVVDCVESAMKCIKMRQEHIQQANRSSGGWRTVNEYIKNEFTSDSEDDKRIDRAESRAAKSIATNHFGAGNISKKRKIDYASGPSL